MNDSDSLAMRIQRNLLVSIQLMMTIQFLIKDHYKQLILKVKRSKS